MMINLNILGQYKVSRSSLIPIFFLFLQACASTRIGNDLANSFDTPNQTNFQEVSSEDEIKRAQVEIFNSDQKELNVPDLSQEKIMLTDRNKTLNA